MRTLILALLAAATGFAQMPAPKSSISGVVLDAGTGKPIADVSVASDRYSQKEIATKTDGSGRFTLRDIEPGTHKISAIVPFEDKPDWGPRADKFVNLTEGQDIASLTFQVKLFGEIVGRVLNEDKEPLPGIRVTLVAREYSLGLLRYVYATTATTDDQGEYRLKRVTTGRAFLVLAQKMSRIPEPISSVPAEPELRKRAYAPTFYPNSIALAGAQALTLRAGERRDAVDIQLRRTQSYCVEALIESPGGPATARFSLQMKQPTSGEHGTGGTFVGSPIGVTGPDGKLRVCDVTPGEYVLTASAKDSGPAGLPPFFGMTEISVTDRDVKNVRVVARAYVPLVMEAVLDGKAPETPIAAKISPWLRPLTRAPWMGEMANSQISIPGNYKFPNLLIDQYRLSINGVPPNLYVKDITYGGISVLHDPITPGTAGNEGALRVILGQDGAILQAKVSDKDGNPIPDAIVYLLPAEINAQEKAADFLISGRTDQQGLYKSAMLRPGKYYAFASTSETDKSPEGVAAIWNARSHAKEVTLSQDMGLVTLEARSLE